MAIHQNMCGILIHNDINNINSKARLYVNVFSLVSINNIVLYSVPSIINLCIARPVSVHCSVISYDWDII